MAIPFVSMQAAWLLVCKDQIMSDRLEVLCAEVRAIDYWEWHYRRATTPRDSDELSHELRTERREEIVSEIQAICAKSRANE